MRKTMNWALAHAAALTMAMLSTSCAQPAEESEASEEQTGTAAGAWAGSAWTDLGGVLASAPAAAAWGPGRLDTFVRGTDDALWHKWYDGAWSGWESLGSPTGGLTSAPAVAAWGPGRLDVFARGADNALWHKYYNGAWSVWESLGGTLTSAPAVVSTRSGRLDVFVLGGGGTLYAKSWDGAWSGWTPLGQPTVPGAWQFDPAATKSRDGGGVDLFLVGPDNQLWTNRFPVDSGSAWSSTAWTSWGGYVNASPAASSWPGHTDVFVIGGGTGADRPLFVRSYDNATGLGPYEQLGNDNWAMAPAATSWAPGRVDYFAVKPGSMSLQQAYMNSTPTNLALGKPTSQSSTYTGSLLSAVSSSAVDGNTNGNWAGRSVTHTNADPQAWWQVDLESVQAIGDVVLWNRTDCCSDRLSNFNLRVSDDGVNWQSFPYAGTAPAQLSFAVNRTARYVKVQLDGTNNLSLAEVQVFSASSDLANATCQAKMTAGHGFWGTGALREFATPNASDCYLQCANDASCSGGTFNPAKQYCWLRTGTASIGGGLSSDYAFTVSHAQHDDPLLPLVARFAPRLRFDGAAPNYPMSAQSFFEQALVVPQSYRVDNTDYSSVANNRVPTYYQVTQCGSQVRIMYWWFYGYQYDCDGVSGEHNGDWERVMVTLSEDRTRAAAVTFWAHKSHYTRIAARDGFEIEDGTHPIVYAGKTTHASYYNQGGSGTCAFWEDWRNNTNGSHMDSWNNVVSLDANAEPWMSADRSGGFAWGNDGVGTHPTQEGPSCYVNACIWDYWGAADAMGGTQCKAGDGDTGVECIEQCGSGYTNTGLLCSMCSGDWWNPFTWYCDTYAPSRYSYDYPIPTTNSGLF